MNEWMTCNSCRALVQVNATGICLGCQMGKGTSIETNYLPKPETKETLEIKKKDLEEALQINEKEIRKKPKKA